MDVAYETVCPPEDPRWAELRRQGIGASDVGAVAGLNPWRKPIDVWLDLTGRSEANLHESAAIRMGHRMEWPLTDWYIEEAEVMDLRPVSPGLLARKDAPWIRATPDRIFRDDQGQDVRLVELKLVGGRVMHHWEEEPPEYVRAQVLWQQLVTGIHEADVAALLGGTQPAIFPMQWDEGAAKLLRDIAEQFWQEHVLKHVPPPIEAGESWRKYLAKSWPANLEPIARATETEEALAQRYFAAREGAVEAHTKAEALEHQLKDVIADRAGLQGRDWRITWQRTKSGGVDWKGLAAELGVTPELRAKYAREGTRRFVPRWPGKGEA
jgi:putative phage-type endonuclease